MPYVHLISNETLQQKMANLPSIRLKPKELLQLLVQIMLDPRRTIKLTLFRHKDVRSTKVYAAVFVYFVTCANHLEVVSSLETATFLQFLIVWFQGEILCVYCIVMIQLTFKVQKRKFISFFEEILHCSRKFWLILRKEVLNI